MPNYLATLTEEKRDEMACADLMRFLSCAAAVRNDSASAAADVYLERFAHTLHAPTVRKALTEWRTKAATTPGDKATWAADLAVAPPVDPLLKIVRADSLLGRIAGARKVPFRAAVPRQTATGTFAWTAPNTPKPVTSLAFDTASLPPGKISGIVVLTLELVKLLSPGSETAMQDALVGALVLFQDAQLVDPAVTLIADARPASITNGLTPITTTGSLAGDVAKLLTALYASCPTCQRPTLLMSPAIAGQLAVSGNQPDLTVAGGTCYGVPTYTSAGCGKQVVALDASQLLYADGGLELAVSTQAAIEMNDAPTMAASAIVSSFWTLDLAGFRVERQLWYVQTPGSVQLLTTP